MPKQSDPSIDKDIANRVEDEWSDRFPNDWLEAFVVVFMLAAIGAGVYALYLLDQVSG